MKITSNRIKRKLLSLFNRDTNYWNKYYTNNPPGSQKESFFANFISKYIQTGKKMVDLGCGNGRDSIYFNNKGIDVIGIDASESVITALDKYSTDNMKFICGDFINDKRLFNNIFDYYYSRFTIHAIDKDGEENLLRNVYRSLVNGGFFFIEARGIHDEKYGKGEEVGKNEYILDGHYRRFINMNELIADLIKTGFFIKYAEEAKGFAPYKNEDSEIIRVIAIK